MRKASCSRPPPAIKALSSRRIRRRCALTELDSLSFADGSYSKSRGDQRGHQLNELAAATRQSHQVSLLGILQERTHMRSRYPEPFADIGIGEPLGPAVRVWTHQLLKQVRASDSLFARVDFATMRPHRQRASGFCRCLRLCASLRRPAPPCAQESPSVAKISPQSVPLAALV